MPRMPDDSSSAVRHAAQRTRELLFMPMDLKFLLYVSTWLTVSRGHGPKFDELRRLRPYYRGTRQLSNLAVLLVLLSLTLPFSVPFVGMRGFATLLLLYIVLIIVVTIASILVESVMDAVFAIEYESGCSLPEALRAFVRYYKVDSAFMIEYMVLKQVVDTVLMTLVMALYLPAALAMIAMLQSIVSAISSGETGIPGLMVPWLAAIAALLLLALLITALLSAPMSAFYGYYTEEAVRAMRQLEHGHD